MSKMNKIQPEDYGNILVKRLSGATYASIADDHGCSAETISKTIKRKKELRDLMNVFEFKDGVAIVGSQLIRIPGDLIYDQIIVTGDEADGIIHATDAYQVRKEDIDDTQLTEGDFGYIGTIKVGVVKLSEPCWANDEPIMHMYEGLEILEVSNESLPDVVSLVINKPTPITEPPVPVVTPIRTIVPPAPSTEPVWNASSKFISITVGRKTYNASNDHPKFKDALQSLIDGKILEAIDMINVEQAVTKYVDGNVVIENGALLYKGIELRSGLITRIIHDMENGKDFKFYLPFLENLMENPSRKAVTRLFDFLEANDIEITKDGHFTAWKVVTNEFKDCFKQMFDNSPGKRVEVPRNQVDEDDNVTCSDGLHVCSKSYIKHFISPSNRLVQVKVHPRDVVSIPIDYNDAKMRTCGYNVLKEVKVSEI